MANERKVITLAKGRLKKMINFMEFPNLVRPPPLFWKFIKNDAVFWPSASQIRGVTFHDSLFWRGEGVGGHKYEIFVIQFLNVLGYTDHFKRHFIYPYKNNNCYGMAEPPPSILENSIKIIIIFFIHSLSA